MSNLLGRLSRSLLAASLLLAAIGAHAQWYKPVDVTIPYGPYHARFLAGAEGLVETIVANDAALDANAPWTIYAWVRTDEIASGRVLVGGFGDPASKDGRYLGLSNGRPLLWSGASDDLLAPTPVVPNTWAFLGATFDGETLRLFSGGAQVAEAAREFGEAAPTLQIAPHTSVSPNTRHFGGEIADFHVLPRALPIADIKAAFKRPPAFDVIAFHNVAVGWPWQLRQQVGLLAPQPPATLPRSAAAFSKPVAKPLVDEPALQTKSSNEFRVAGWRLVEAPKVTEQPASIASTGFDASTWYVATVPGTVLTTLIDRGVYPDPDYGLNNMAIPESLNKQNYWYRTEFDAPASIATRELTLTFKSINYAANVWLNGEQLGNIQGGFIRGIFDVTGKLKAGEKNVLAVKIYSPPHPGIPHEQSIKAGPGENGGQLAIDGPTFVASEGWDWIPGIRDRNVGLWQDVMLSVSGPVRIQDPQVITMLPLPRTDRADIYINVPLENRAATSVQGTLTARFDHVTVSKEITLKPGATLVRLAPSEFQQLSVANPRLWWPNGYGKQELYGLNLSFADGATQSDTKNSRFGIRHVTYELSLFDEAGKLQRVDVDVAQGSARGERLIDVTHEALKKSPKGWAASLYPRALKSPAVRVLDDHSLTPHLAIRVNGVRISSRGGNWGMDDSRKRVSRERLEPYFRLHKEANVNTIRNWVGQNTQDSFFELADEYGMMILNDFWASTQNFQVEPQDPQLFFANARDVIARYRNHPSIVLWFGRNEGVPHPILNEGLADLVAEVDGTRHFTGSSNVVNLSGSGPYNYRPPVQYFNQHAEGYSVEVGTPSLSTLESIKAWTPQEDLWPISDSLAYHDWHHGGNGDVKSFMETLERQFGAATSLEDFERKAQMMNYVTYRALFEGYQAHLWTKNSGRLLWMTHPAWPSNAWQIYSSDYDTHAAYYGTKKANEPLHVQMNLPDYQLAVINTQLRQVPQLRLHSRVLTLDNRVLEERTDQLSAAANAVTNAQPLNLLPHLEAHGVVLVKLELMDASGRVLSENFYWEGKDDGALRKLNELPESSIKILASSQRLGEEVSVRVLLENATSSPVLANKLTLLDAKGARILPAYYSDNYVSMLPGERREIEIRYPASEYASNAKVALRGWNTKQTNVTARPTR
jgi:beta-galactosidase/beta-glucuronidase